MIFYHSSTKSSSSNLTSCLNSTRFYYLLLLASSLVIKICWTNLRDFPKFKSCCGFLWFIPLRLNYDLTLRFYRISKNWLSYSSFQIRRYLFIYSMRIPLNSFYKDMKSLQNNYYYEVKIFHFSYFSSLLGVTRVSRWRSSTFQLISIKNYAIPKTYSCYPSICSNLRRYF